MWELLTWDVPWGDMLPAQASNFFTLSRMRQCMQSTAKPSAKSMSKNCIAILPTIMMSRWWCQSWGLVVVIEEVLLEELVPQQQQQQQQQTLSLHCCVY